MRLCKTQFAHDQKVQRLMRTGCLVMLVGSVTLGPGQSLSAKPLALDTCLSLWRQTEAAKSNGLDALLATGAEDARTRLSKKQLNQIKSHITLIERLKFRCRRFVPPPPGAETP